MHRRFSEAVSLHRGRGLCHVRKVVIGTQETRPGPTEWSSSGAARKGEPERVVELRSGVGLADSTEEAVEGNEMVEGSGQLGGIPNGRSQVRTQSRVAWRNRLARVNKAAKRDRRARFTALLHHVTVDALERSFRRLHRGAAAGVDGVTVS